MRLPAVPLAIFASVTASSTSPASGSPVQLVSVPLDGVPRAGVTRVGEVAKTSAPLPVSSEITPASCEDVVAANWESGLPTRASPPPAMVCQEDVPSPSSRRNFVPPVSPVDRIAVPSWLCAVGVRASLRRASLVSINVASVTMALSSARVSIAVVRTYPLRF